MHDNLPGEFKVIGYGVKSFVGNWRGIDYGDPNDERMAALRQEFGLEQVVAGAESEFEGFLALKRWVRSRWNHGWCRTEVKDGLDILRAAAEGKQFQCGHFAMTYVDCARALGWPARLTGISVASCEAPRDYQIGNIGHAIVEIWSNELEKWVALDPDVNVYYRRSGVPLNAVEIRDAWLSGAADSVEMVQDQPTFVMPSGTYATDLLNEEAPYRTWNDENIRLMLERFGRFRVLDYYERVTAGGFEWVDGRHLPTFVSHFAPKGVRPTTNLADLYWSLNMTRLAAKPSWDADGSRLNLALEHCMPWFDHFEARIDGGDWRAVEAEFDWPMREGVNRLECRAVNVCRRPGAASTLVVAHARQQL
ncbi:MAG: transglutaminase domain-containing protein [Anaerolineae bacterium]